MDQSREVHYRAVLQTGAPLHPTYDEYIKVRDTPKGIVVCPIWIYDYYDHEDVVFKQKCRLALHDTINKWCYPTKEEAYFALIKRSEKRIGILLRQINAVKDFLDNGSYEKSLEKELLSRFALPYLIFGREDD